MESVKLLEEYCIAVCSPNYYDKHIKAVDGEDITSLAGCPCYLNSRLSAWYDYPGATASWKAPCGTNLTPSILISAALLGYGVALVPRIW